MSSEKKADGYEKKTRAPPTQASVRPHLRRGGARVATVEGWRRAACGIGRDGGTLLERVGWGRRAG
jgi:hypothetical protein